MNEKQNLKDLLGFHKNDFLIVNLSKEDYLIRLMPYLDENIKMIALKTEMLEKQMKEYHLENRIYFLEDNEDYFKISNLGIITDSSDEEYLKKAMSLQIPLLAFNCKNKQQFIKNDVTGYVINSQNEMINMIHFLKNNKKYNYNLGMNSYYYLENSITQV